MAVAGSVDYNYGSTGYLAEYTFDASTVAPEPGTWMGGAAAMGILIWVRKRRGFQSGPAAS
jgi:hypothetical protein